MSDQIPGSPSAPAATPPSGNQAGDAMTEAKRSGFAALRLKILLGILALGLVGMAWDFLVARPQSAKAYQLVLDNTNSRVGGDAKIQRLSDKEVHELLGRKPAEEFQWEGRAVEAFHWRGGLPTKKYKVYVVYDNTPEGPRVSTATYLKSPYEQFQNPKAANQDKNHVSTDPEPGFNPGPAPNPPGTDPPLITPPDITPPESQDAQKNS